MSRNRRPLRSITLNLKEGNDIDELRTAYRSKADAVTHELEEHCPDRFKDVARKNIRRVLEEHGHTKPTFVRVSTADNPRILDDLEAVVCANLHGVMLPKVQDENDIVKVDYYRCAYEIVKASQRVEYMISATNANGDPARSIGYQWTRECTETLYIREKIVLDTRAAGMQWPVSSNWNAMNDLDGLEKFLTQNRHIGYFGAICTPEPTYVDIVNRIFTPSQEEIDLWGEIVSLQEQYDNDVKIDGKWYARNRSQWGRQRLGLAAAFGVHPRPDRRKMKVEQVGGIVKAAEAEQVGSMGRSDA